MDSALPVLSPEELIQFEEEIKELFLAGKIRAPVHLSRGNEEQLIEIFKDVKPNDWVFSTHRNHYHALLKGIPPDWLKQEILAGRSMHINNAEYKFFTSAIVGGICPIAVGVAMALKWKGINDKVWCFVGDMAAEMGIFYECVKYCARHHLRVVFWVEDNGLSTNTPTQEVWGGEWTGSVHKHYLRYEYERVLPHINVGKFVVFS